MSVKTSNRLSMGAMLLSILVPVGNKALDTTQKVLEAKLITVEKETKGESELTYEMMFNMLERVVANEAKLKELEAKVK